AQVIRNFVSNALKYTERGHVRLSARMRDARIVEISVEDTGIGIAPEDQPRIFEEFVQVESARQRLHKGTGLGLALSRRL
ncbi:ATP-binding protein, partial [Staphylococcus aureus]